MKNHDSNSNSNSINYRQRKYTIRTFNRLSKYKVQV